MSRFETVSRLPRLAKYVRQEAFSADPRPDKILVTTGAFKTELGDLPSLASVGIADQRVRERRLSTYYLDIAGYPPFAEAVSALLLANALEALTPDRIITAHTPGGTAALRVGADFIRTQWPDASVWISNPTWDNHIRVFEAAGLTVKRYQYYDAQKREFRIGALMNTIQAIPRGDVILFQSAPHNPAGIEPTVGEWEQIAEAVARQELLPFFDVAFFGFAVGLREDLCGIGAACRQVSDLLIASSYSKSFSLYNSRIGALSLVGQTQESVLNVYSHVRHLIRANYSNPPLHGAAVVAEILSDDPLCRMWLDEIAQVRHRIARTRSQLAACLGSSGSGQDLSYILRERGLFTDLNLPAGTIRQIRELHGIHMSSTGRINVSSMTDEQLERFCSLVGPHLQ